MDASRCWLRRGASPTRLRVCKAAPQPNGQRAVARRERGPSSSSAAVRETAKRARADLRRFPALREVVRSMNEEGRKRVSSPAFAVNSPLFCLRLETLGKLSKLKRRLSLSDETFLLAIWLFDEYISKIGETNVAVIQRIALSALFIAAKFQEITPPRMREVLGEALSVEEFRETEERILKSVDYRIVPPSYISFIHIINHKALASPLWAGKIRRAVYIALFGNYAQSEEPLIAVIGIALLFATQELPAALPALRQCCKEFEVDEEKCFASCLRLSQRFRAFYPIFTKHKKSIESLLENAEIFTFQKSSK